MAKKPHELHEDFPEFADVLGTLRDADGHFARLVEEYEAVNLKIFRAETNIDPMEDLAMIQMRKDRGVLKDQIFAALKGAQPTS